MQYNKLLIPFLLLIFWLTTANAQRAEVGINAGGAGYMGDLNQNNPLKISGISAGAFARINFDPYWGLGLHYTYGNVKADDAKSNNLDFKQRNLSFYSAIHEFSIQGNLNFFDIYSPISKKRFTPYIYAGIGGFLFEPRRKAVGGGSDPILRLWQTEGPEEAYRNYAIVVPYGAGAKYKLSENLTAFSQIGYRTTFTDYLDDVSGVYPALNAWGDPATNEALLSQSLSDPSVLLPPNIKKFNPGDQRGDFRKRDTYMFVSIGISYTFVSQKCFTF